LNAAGICWDNSLALAIFLWLVVAASRIRNKAGMVELGVGCGLLLLTNAAYAAAVPVVLLIARFSSQRNKNAHVGWEVATATGNGGQCPPYNRLGFGVVAVVVTLLPWTARNYIQFNRLLFVRGNLAAELWLGNQPGTTGWTTLAMLQSHPSVDPVERRLVFQLGEMKYFDLCRRRFWDEFHDAPGDFIRRCGYRAAYLLLGEPSRPHAAMDIALAGVGLTGIWIAWRKRMQSAGIAAAGLLAGLPYVPTQVHDRYALPVRAMLTLMAAAGICAVIERLAFARNRTFQKEPLPAGHTLSQSPRRLIWQFDNTRWNDRPDAALATIVVRRRPARKSECN